MSKPHYERPGRRARDWHDEANCAPHHRAAWGLSSIEQLDALFEVQPHARIVPEQVRVICGLCPVRQDCLREAVLEQRAAIGGAHALIRGGLMPSQIKALANGSR